MRLVVALLLLVSTGAWFRVLPSYNDGAARQPIVEFGEAVTTEGGKDFFAAADAA